MTETVEEFRARARAWIQGNLAEVELEVVTLRDRTDEEELTGVARDREIQRMLFDAGLAGVCFPVEYGGQGLTPAHQKALNEELRGREYPMRLQVPNMTPCASILLEFGSHEQKLEHLPKLLRGDEIWMQMLSEPSAGSDLAGAVCSAVREGDEWILNGSKIWTTGGWWQDWGLLLARTNWDVPKHRGLSVFILPITREGVSVHRIEMLNGNREFCQEFFTDVRVPDSDRIGEVDDGWTIATRWLFHERMLHNSPFITMPGADGQIAEQLQSIEIARDVDALDDPAVRGLVGEELTLSMVGRALNQRISSGIRSGHLSEPHAAVNRLFVGTSTARRKTIHLEIAGSVGAAWLADDGEVADAGTDHMMRQASCIAGGTIEIARNVIAERALGMPREPALDRTGAFRDAPRGGR